MRICAWNVNNRVGRVPFRTEAAYAAAAIDVDVIVLNEFYPAGRQDEILAVLRDAGWPHQLMSRDTGVKANRILIASRLPLEPLDLALPTFDAQFPANVAGAYVPGLGLKLVGLRVPAYGGATAPFLPMAWDWIEATAASLREEPAIMLGDLNTSVSSTGAGTRPQLARMLGSGWTRAAPTNGPSFFGSSGARAEIDHVLSTALCYVEEAGFVTRAGPFVLAGDERALSDHAALVCRVRVVN